jgi:hypothetical protein
MATLTASQSLQPTAPKREGPAESLRLAQGLQPWRRRITLLQVIHWPVRGIILGLGIVCLILLVSRIVPWATAPYWAIGVGLACPVIALCAALWDRPTITHTASIVDRQLHLHDRMRTAWELREQSSVLTGLQRRDALKQLQQYTPATSLPIRFRRSTPTLALVGCIILALLITLPNPMTDYLRQQANLQTKIAKQVNTVEQLRHSIDQQKNLPQSEKKQIDQILKDLEAKLQNAHSENEAQQALAEAQAKLDQLRDPQATNKTQAQKAAAQSLQCSNGACPYPNSTLKALGQALANNDSKALQKALQDLANQASQLDSQQRSQLAQDIAKAANEASQNPALSSALQQLSKALTDGSPSEIADALKAVEAAANQTSNEQNSENALNKASQGLQNAANNLASSTDSTSPNSQSQQGQNRQGQQGQNGQVDQGQRQGGQDQGRSGGNNGAGNKHGNNEQVYVPGQIGQGNSQQSTDNNTSAVESGNQVSYQQVLEQYNQMAHDAIDNSNIAPDLKDLVHDYFNTLEGQQ